MWNIHGNVRGRTSEENCPGLRNYGEYSRECPRQNVRRKLSGVEKLWGIFMGMFGGESPKKNCPGWRNVRMKNVLIPLICATLVNTHTHTHTHTTQL